MGGAMPQLGLSTGPAVAEAGGSGYGSTGTGDFWFKQPAQKPLLEQIAPWALAGLVVWLLVQK